MLITSVENNIVKQTVKLSSSKKARDEQGLFVIEGIRLCLDAKSSGIHIKYLLFTEQAQAKYAESLQRLADAAAEMYMVTEQVMNKLADTKTPQGVLCVCAMPQAAFTADVLKQDGIYVGLENISDPGNLGTIIRTAEAVGVAGLIIGGDSCDYLSPKVLRGSMGGAFRLPVFVAEDMCQLCDTFKNSNMQTFAAVVQSGAESLLDTHCTGGIVFIGNEGAGLTEALAARCDRRITIPMRGRAESLNAAMAAGIIMFELTTGQ